MRSKNSRPLDSLDEAWLTLVKLCPCSVCAAPGPSYAHHTKQGNHHSVAALCWECHQGPMGIHGDQRLWKIHKVTENDAINITVRNVFELLTRDK